MHKALLLLTLLLSLTSVCPVQGKTPYMPSEELQSEAQRGFGEILDLWHEGRYAELYERTTTGGRSSKEQFVRKLSAASRKPACCWEKMQEVKISVKNDSTVSVRAKLGFEGDTAGTDFTTRAFKLIKEEDGVWRISQTDILSLAGATKKKGHHKKRTKKDNP